MSKELNFDGSNLPSLDLSCGKSPLEIEVESDIEMLDAGLSPDEIAQMAIRSRELLLRYSHYDFDEGDDEGTYDV